MLPHQRFQHGQSVMGRGVRNGRPGQLHAAGQIANRQDLVVATIDGAGWLGMIDGPDCARVMPLQRFDDQPMVLLELSAVAGLQVSQDRARRFRAAGLEGRQTQLLVERLRPPAESAAAKGARTRPSTLRQGAVALAACCGCPAAASLRA